MAKIFLKSELKNEEETTFFEGVGIYIPDKITYQEENVTTVIKKEENTITLTRKNKDYEITMKFEKGKTSTGIYNIPSLRKYFHLQMKTTVLEWNNQEIKIVYELDLEKEKLGTYQYFLKYEVTNY